MAVATATPATLRRIFRVVSPTCEDMTALISAMLDRRPSLRTRLRMRIHFLYCRYCRRVREQFAFFRRASLRLDTAEAVTASEAELSLSEKENLQRVLRRRP